MAQIHDHLYRTLIIGGSESGKANWLYNLISHQQDINKIYLYAKNPYKEKYQMLINELESTGLKYSNDFKAVIKYSNDMDDIYINIEECNSNKKRKILIVFYARAGDLLSNKIFNPMVTELYFRGRKLNLSLVFLAQSYFAVPKDIRLNLIRYFIMKIPNKRELH